MRIESVANISPMQTTGSISSEVRKNASNVQAISSNSNNQKDNYSYQELSQKTKYELSIDESVWINMIERANKAITGATCSFEYSIHESTKQIMVKVINRDTKEIIREIPPEKILDMVAKMWEMAGILVDERR
ncbi:flagellar protein FlaG [Lutispora saccharofermentans]|uniref:Flagellar protein FlaG n=1 Tax=Lutispora saccharofermentans TaxID=3024236 RepID=A0ABT1NEL4_9FIRM|nr:flagellar protein FlaG [Lutispora saccharofermentans]